MRYTPKGCSSLHHYQFLVITDESDDVVHAKYKSHPYALGQIIICDVTGGIPIEIGTHVKPGKLNCSCEPFDVMDQAIEFSYMITDTGWDKKNAKQKIKLKKRMLKKSMPV